MVVADFAQRVGAMLQGVRGPMTNGLRLGIDVAAVDYFAHLMERPAGQRFLLTRFTEVERTYITSDPARIAVRWAAKEAVSKAIGTGFRGIRPIDIQINRTPEGQPLVERGTSEDWPLSAHQWDWSITMSEDDGAAVAIALAIPKGEADDFGE
ncbi:holo-ACP synthase [Microbacterium sulfonylureivorans]|uniref:holo-ACP synthase n=1 Tax=Microbacterium sulfonylureivorans TaxID=2486854 RepID=UPI0013DFD616|nr:4'-phosphopantetheinyl transferase superfamily protein [Microbacterium sulfonylureivorans]